jgi:membrane AbrB-like protein
LEGVLYFILTLFVAVVGSLLARKLRVPAGGMLGAMIAVAALNLLTGKAVFPSELRTVVQIFSGAMVGSRIARKDVLELRHIIIPTILLMIMMIIMNITIGVSMHKLGGLDIATAMFASSPGGMSDMALLAEDLGANSSYVTVLQLLRLLTIYIFMPGLVKKIAAKSEAKRQVGDPRRTVDNSQVARDIGEVLEEPSKKIRMRRLIMTILVATAGGLLFHYLGVTAGAMLGSMIAVAIYNITTGLVYYPPPARNYTQIFSGAFLGMRMDMASVLGLSGLAIPALLEIFGVLGFAFLSAFLISKITKLDFCLALMASTPGGLQEMSILSEELNQDTPKIAVMQTARLMSVIAVFPTMIRFVASLF